MYSRYLLEQVGHHGCPAGLMACANTAPRITMEVLVEWDVITPMRIVLERRVRAKDRSATLLVTQKDAGETMREILRYLP